MKKKIFTIIILTISTFAFTQQRWEVTLGKPEVSEVATGKVQSYDNGFSVIGNERWGKNILIKTNVNGNKLWQKTFINPNYFQNAWSIIENSEGEMIVVGDSDISGVIMKLNPCGEIEWCTRFTNPEYNLVVFVDAVLNNNGEIIVAAFMQRVDGDKTNQDYLFCFNNDGELLWKKPYASLDDYPLFNDRIIWKLDYFENYYIMTGDAYYPYPSNPDLVIIRPFFIRVDNDFNEVFVLPFGVNDSIVGVAHQTKDIVEDTYNIGIGTYSVPYSMERYSMIMRFDSLGNEINYRLISNSSFDSSLVQNSGLDIVNTDQDTELIELFLEYDDDYRTGYITVDSEDSVHHYKVIDNSMPTSTPNITVVSDSTNLIAASLMELPITSNYDILLSKLNSDLSSAPIDTNTYEYDYLCNDLPIASDTIYIDNCSIITDIGEVPTPKQYYSSLKTIPIHIFPNPASSGITFEFGNTEHHKNIVLRVMDINGQIVFEQKLPNGETQINTSVSSWQSGMYIATASSRRGGSGNGKFVVK